MAPNAICFPRESGPWHHRGSPPLGLTQSRGTRFLGPRHSSRSSPCSLKCFPRRPAPFPRPTKWKLCIYLTSFRSFVYRWKLNGTEISPRSGSHYSLSGGNLRISHLNKDHDAGTYQCLASNSFGTIVSREASLTFACEFCFTSLWVNFFWASEVPMKKKKSLSAEMKDNAGGTSRQQCGF